MRPILLALFILSIPYVAQAEDLNAIEVFDRITIAERQKNVQCDEYEMGLVGDRLLLAIGGGFYESVGTFNNDILEDNEGVLTGDLINLRGPESPSENARRQIMMFSYDGPVFVQFTLLVQRAIATSEGFEWENETEILCNGR